MPIKPNAPRKNRKSRIIATVVVLLVAGVGSVYLYHRHQHDQAVAKERAQYAQAEKDLDKLTTQIIATLGQPDDQKKIKECGYTSDTFELSPKGRLYCDVESYVYYGVSNLGDAKNRVGLVMATQIISGTLRKENPEESSASQPPIRLGSQDFSLAGLSCFSAYGYHLATEDLSISGYPTLRLRSEGQGLLINLDCSVKNPKSEYYPLH